MIFLITMFAPKKIFGFHLRFNKNLHYSTLRSNNLLIRNDYYNTSPLEKCIDTSTIKRIRISSISKIILGSIFSETLPTERIIILFKCVFIVECIFGIDSSQMECFRILSIYSNDNNNSIRISRHERTKNNHTVRVCVYRYMRASLYSKNHTYLCDRQN